MASTAWRCWCAAPGGTTIVLTGHYDTVSTRDYAELEDLASQPEKLIRALSIRLSAADTPAARRKS